MLRGFRKCSSRTFGMHVISPAGEAAPAGNFAFRADIERERAGLNVDRDILGDHRFGALVTAAQEDVHRAVVFEKPRLGNFPANVLLVVRRQFVFLAALLAVVNRNPVEGMPGMSSRGQVIVFWPCKTKLTQTSIAALIMIDSSQS